VPNEALKEEVFSVLTYLFLQFSVASHQRRHLDTIGARVYFWLLALFPIWCIPVAWALLQVIYYFARIA
jgi:hypothetical protein